MKTPLIIDRWLQESERHVTVFTLLAAIAALGVGSAFLGPLNGFYLALGTFAAIGALDVLHTNTKASLKKRQADFIEPEGDLFFAAIQQKGWRPVVIEEFTHCGLLFETRGFDEIPGGITLSYPFCPRCKNKVFERVCSDRATMFGFSYAEWLLRGNEIEEHLKSQGGVFAKAEGTADEFVAWCKLNSHDTTSESRLQFTVFKLLGDGLKG